MNKNRNIFPKLYQGPTIWLLLKVTDGCNLKCKYCYCKQKGSCKKMSFSTAKKSVDYFLNKFKNFKYFCISFSGGESLLNFDVIRKTVFYAQKKAKRTLFGGELLFQLYTNGVLLSPAINKFLFRNGFLIRISIDGPDYIHNAYRKFANGEGSYNIVMANAIALLKLYKTKNMERRITINSVFSPRLLNIQERIAHFVKCGFKSYIMAPTSSAPNTEFFFSVKDMDRFFNEYSKLIRWGIQQASMGWQKKSLRDKLYGFFPFLWKMPLGAPLKLYYPFCGAGVTSFAVLPNRNIYSCHVLAEENRGKVGNIINGIDNKMQMLYKHNDVDSRKECQKCSIRYSCGGGCLAENGEIYDNFFKPSKIWCDYIKRHSALDSKLYAKLSKKLIEIN